MIDDFGRLLALARNTLFLVGGTAALSLPLGIAGAVLLYRTDLPLRRWLRFLVLLTLFIPLPLFTSGWQTVLGSGGWLPLALWNPPRPEEPASALTGAAWTPWGQGIGSAIWIQTVAALPWVVLLVGQGLCWVERELEEDALTATGPWRVLRRVSLRRAHAALAFAALWVALQAATEITITDVMQVRTFAEEVYTQFVAPEMDNTPGDAVARAVVVSLPLVLLTTLLLIVLARRWERNLPPRADLIAPPLRFPLGRLRWPLGLAVAASCVLLLLVPLSSLLWRVGLEGTPPGWSFEAACRYLTRAVRGVDGRSLLESLLLAGAAGAACATLAWGACWAARDARWFHGAVLVVMALLWAMPGPIIGLGLKETISFLLDVTHSALLARLLWHGPSLAPLLCVDLIRFFPFAVAVLWPVVRLLPQELRDAARVDGASPLQEMRHVLWPLCRTAWLRAALVVTVLALGEVSAGKLVSTPGASSYAQRIFEQMHYGVTNELAARCLLLLLAVSVAAIPACGVRNVASPER